jgi:hypothetical protein
MPGCPYLFSALSLDLLPTLRRKKIRDKVELRSVHTRTCSVDQGNAANSSSHSKRDYRPPRRELRMRKIVVHGGKWHGKDCIGRVCIPGEVSAYDKKVALRML